MKLIDCCFRASTSVRGVKLMACGHISHFINVRNFDLELNFPSAINFVTKGNG